MVTLEEREVGLSHPPISIDAWTVSWILSAFLVNCGH